MECYTAVKTQRQNIQSVNNRKDPRSPEKQSVFSVCVPFCQHIQNCATLSPTIYHPRRVKGCQKASCTTRPHRPEGLNRTRRNRQRPGSKQQNKKVINKQEDQSGMRTDSETWWWDTSADTVWMKNTGEGIVSFFSFDTTIPSWTCEQG